MSFRMKLPACGRASNDSTNFDSSRQDNINEPDVNMFWYTNIIEEPPIMFPISEPVPVSAPVISEPTYLPCEPDIKHVSVHTTKGEKGDTGEQGLPGERGLPGEKGDTGERGKDGSHSIFWSGNSCLDVDPVRVCVFPINNTHVKFRILVEGNGAASFSVKDMLTDQDLCREIRVVEGIISTVEFELENLPEESVLGLFASGENLVVVSVLLSA